jgi:hypothetical protein
LTDVVAIYVAALNRAVDQLLNGLEPDRIEAAAESLGQLDPGHPVLPALRARARERRGRMVLH